MNGIYNFKLFNYMKRILFPMFLSLLIFLPLISTIAYAQSDSAQVSSFIQLTNSRGWGLMLDNYKTITLGLIVLYACKSLALMEISTILNIGNEWFAWIPILDLILLFNIADYSPLWIVLIVPPFTIFSVTILVIVATAKVCEKLGRNRLLSLLNLIPGLGTIILLGLLAWGDTYTVEEVN